MSHRLAPAHWGLHKLLPGPEGPALDDHLSRLEATVAEVEPTRAGPPSDPATPEFLDLLHRDEAIGRFAARLGAETHPWFAEDTHNSAALDLRSRIEELEAIG
jgi:hypothetical protein